MEPAQYPSSPEDSFFSHDLSRLREHVSAFLQSHRERESEREPPGLIGLKTDLALQRRLTSCDTEEPLSVLLLLRINFEGFPIYLLGEDICSEMSFELQQAFETAAERIIPELKEFGATVHYDREQNLRGFLEIHKIPAHAIIQLLKRDDVNSILLLDY